MKPAGPAQPARRQHRNMLQIALAPSPIAYRKVSQSRSHFLIAAGQTRHHVYRPAAAPHQRRLDEIMAHDWPTKRLAPTQFRQPAALRESARADHRVMAPVVTLSAMPPSDAVRDQRPVHASRELLHPS